MTGYESNYYTLSLRAINYLISSDADNTVRQFLRYILQQHSSSAVSTDILSSWDKMPEDKLYQLINKLISLSWLIRSDSIDEVHLYPGSQEFSTSLSSLSSVGQAILADEQGLLITNAGYSSEVADYIAASAASILSNSELIRHRLPDLYNGQPWSTTLHWGHLQSRVQYIFMADKVFILVVAGKRQFDTPVYIQVLGALARRYAHE